MQVIESHINRADASFKTNAAHNRTLAAELSERLLEQVKAPAATDPDSLSSSESVSGGNVLEALHTLEGASDFKRAWRELRDAWVAERVDRERFNADHFDTAWDFASGDYSTTVGHGVGRPDIPSAPGEFSVERRGDLLLRRIGSDTR